MTERERERGKRQIQTDRPGQWGGDTINKERDGDRETARLGQKIRTNCGKPDQKRESQIVI